MSEFTLTDFILAILVLIGACIGGYWSYRGSQDAIKKQFENEKKTIAKVIDIDLKNIYESPYFYKYYDAHKYDDLTKNDAMSIEDIKLPGKLYDDKTLLYYVFTHDIAKLDYNLSSEIFEFYNNLFKADNYWDFVLKNILPYSEQYMLCIENKRMQDLTLQRYHEMKFLIIKCGDKIPELREKLKEVYDS